MLPFSKMMQQISDLKNVKHAKNEVSTQHNVTNGAPALQNALIITPIHTHLNL